MRIANCMALMELFEKSVGNNIAFIIKENKFYVNVKQFPAWKYDNCQFIVLQENLEFKLV